MHHALSRLGKPQDHVVILTSVTFLAESSHAIEQGTAEDRKMTNIVIGAKIVGGKIGLEMHRRDLLLVRAFKGHLVGVHEIGVLLANGAHDLVERGGMQNVVVIKERDIVARRHIDAGVGVTRNAEVFLKLAIQNTRLALGKLSDVLANACVRVVASVRQTQLPIRVGLRRDRRDHLVEKPLGRIVKRHQNADLDLFGEYRRALRFQLLVGIKRLARRLGMVEQLLLDTPQRIGKTVRFPTDDKLAYLAQDRDTVYARAAHGLGLGLGRLHQLLKFSAKDSDARTQDLALRHRTLVQRAIIGRRLGRFAVYCFAVFLIFHAILLQ